MAQTKEEKNAYNRAYRAANPEKVAAKNAAFRAANKEKYAADARAYRAANPDKVRAQQQASKSRRKDKIAVQKANWNAANADKVKAQTIARRLKNKEKIAAQGRAHKEANRDKARTQQKNWREARRETDPAYKPTERLRASIRQALKRGLDGASKTSTTVKYLGCSIPEALAHIEALFRPGMTWDNWTHDGWHLDHIRPIASFDQTDKTWGFKANHYTNLQPLWASENYEKTDKWEPRPT